MKSQGSLIQTNSRAHTHTHLEMHEHTLNNAGDNAELVAGLNGFFFKKQQEQIEI